MPCQFSFRYTSLYLFYIIIRIQSIFSFFFFNDTATTEIYTLSLHDALPISICEYSDQMKTMIESGQGAQVPTFFRDTFLRHVRVTEGDRKSTRLNSSHQIISYAVFCLKKKKILYKRIQCNRQQLTGCHVSLALDTLRSIFFI